MKTPETLATIRRRVAARVSRMTPERAMQIIEAINKRGSTIHVPEIADLTGGYNTQNLNWYVTRKLGIRAGIVKNPNGRTY